MTKVKYRIKPVWHETAMIDSHSKRVLCVAESPANCLIRLKGTRQVLKLPWSLAYLRAATLEANIERLNKINNRRNARRGVLAK